MTQKWYKHKTPEKANQQQQQMQIKIHASTSSYSPMWSQPVYEDMSSNVEDDYIHEVLFGIINKNEQYEASLKWYVKPDSKYSVKLTIAYESWGLFLNYPELFLIDVNDLLMKDFEEHLKLHGFNEINDAAG